MVVSPISGLFISWKHLFKMHDLAIYQKMLGYPGLSVSNVENVSKTPKFCGALWMAVAQLLASNSYGRCGLVGSGDPTWVKGSLTRIPSGELT